MKTLVRFRGHPNISASHSKTLEITKEAHLTTGGDCIIGVEADAACLDLNPRVKRILQEDGSMVNILIVVEDEHFTLTGSGSSKLAMTHPQDIVIRKTSFTNCRRTIAVNSDGAAIDLPRSMVKRLQKGADGMMIIEVFRGPSTLS